MPSLSIHALSLALCLSSGFQQGYIASVLNQPYIHIEQFINASWIDRTGEAMSRNSLNVVWSLLNVSFPVSTIFGQFIAAWMCNRLGRKRTALLASAMYIPGALLCAGAKSLGLFELLFLGRIIWSLANGINSVNATVWIVECAPPQIRGRMAAMQEFFMAFGSLLTQAVGVPFASEDLWPLVFLPNVFVVVLSLLVFCFVWESPQYIMEREGDEAKARKALAAYHGVSVEDPSVEAEMRICEDAVKSKKGEMKDSVYEHSGSTIMFNPWKADDVMSKVIRHAAWLGVMVKIAYVFTGARCLRSYSTFILHSMGGWSFEQALYGSFVVGLLRLPVTLVPVFLVDRLGRRPLMIVSTAVSLLALVSMMAGIQMAPEWKIATFMGLNVLLLINACGIGSVSRFYAAELVPRSLLLSSVSTLTMFEALTKIAVEFSFYPMASMVAAPCLLMFLLPTAVCLILMWRLCPETSRRSVHEVLNEIAERKSLKVFFPL